MNESVAESEQQSRSDNRSASPSETQRSQSSSSCHTNYTGNATNVTTVEPPKRRNSLTTKTRPKSKNPRNPVPITLFLEGVQRNI